MKVLKTEEDYVEALQRIALILDSSPDSKKEDEAELLMLLIEYYDEKAPPIISSDSIEAIKFRMEQTGMNKKNQAEVLGYKSRVTEILNKKRKLSLKTIRNLHEKMSIPYESLMANY